MELTATSYDISFTAVVCVIGVIGVLGLAFECLKTWYQLVNPKSLNSSGPYSWPVLGVLPDVIKNLDRYHDWKLEKTAIYGKNLKAWVMSVPHDPFIILHDPRDVEHILKTNFNNYEKSEDFQEVFQELLGDGIFNTNGSKWKAQRKTASHMFSLKVMRETMHREITKCSTKLLDLVAQKVHTREEFDIQNMFFRATMDAICLIAFGQDVGCLDSDVGSTEFTTAFDSAQLHMVSRLVNPWWRINRFLGTPAEKQFVKDIEVINNFAANIIETRRKTLTDNPNSEHFDLLSLFLKDAHKRKEIVSDKYLRDIVMSFVIAGRDTTACVLSWLFYELTEHPLVERKLVEEFERVVNNDGTLDYKDASKLEYFDAVFYETLRIHPSVAEDFKRCIKADQLPSGIKIPEGGYVDYAPYIFGRSPELWENASVFQPDRWLGEDNQETPAKVNQYKFCHFNAGPRLCLGKHVAVMEAKVLATALLHRYKFFAVDGQDVHYKMSVTLPIKDGFKVIAKPR